MKSIVLLFLFFSFVHGNKTVAVDSNIGAGEVRIMPAIDVIPNIKITPYTIAPEIQEACKYETPEEQFLRVDSENTTEVDFEGYNKMVDNCGRAYRQQDFDRMDTNKDGKLSWDEWIGEQNRIKEEQRKAELQFRQSSFNRSDVDGDGFLDLNEFENYLEYRSLNNTNAEEYLDSLEGGHMDFDQFDVFEQTTPNDTFPFKVYSYEPIMYTFDNVGGNGTKSHKKGKNNKKNKKNNKKNKNKVFQHLSLIPSDEVTPVDDSGLKPFTLDTVVRPAVQPSLAAVSVANDDTADQSSSSESGDSKSSGIGTLLTQRLSSAMNQRLADLPAVAQPAKLG